MIKFFVLILYQSKDAFINVFVQVLDALGYQKILQNEKLLKIHN